MLMGIYMSKEPLISPILDFTGTVKFSREITIPQNFTAERAENAETLEKTSGVWLFRRYVNAHKMYL